MNDSSKALQKIDSLVCRICKNDLSCGSTLLIPDMPSSAQGFLAHGDLSNDRKISIRIVQCSECGVVQTLEQPVHYWRDVIRATSISPEMKAFRREQFALLFDEFGAPGHSILEVGCFDGTYLSLLKDAGFSPLGTEHGERAANNTSNLGFSVFQTFPESPEKIQMIPRVDAIASFNFMEHWPDPLGTLKILRERLKPDGYGLIEVPNFDMILDQRLFSEFISDHIFYFTESTLRTTLALAGFEVVSITRIWYDYILSAKVRIRPPMPVSGFEQYRQSLCSELKSICEKHADGGVAVWGAGHQSLALLSTSGISSEIKYIVDSATFKQNLYAPGSKIKIMAPEHLFANPVSAIIVIAGGYSQEVKNLIKKAGYPVTYIYILNDNGFALSET